MASYEINYVNLDPRPQPGVTSARLRIGGKQKMACFRPLKGYRARTLNPTGKRSITFNAKEAFHDLKIDLPCGQCRGCRLERSRQWAIRCVHESKLHEDNCFITLTYDEQHRPQNGSLEVKDFQDFMKRLRRKFEDKKIRFFHCGEYGELTARPHYHACLFGINFEDRKPWKKENGQQYYRSETLEKLWPAGNSMVGALTFESAAYVARYIMKKATGPYQDLFYTIYDEETGELVKVKPEYVTMSRRPGIGMGFFEKYKSGLYPDDFVVIRGKKMKPPKFYLAQFEITDPDIFKKIKARRQNEGRKHAWNNTHERLKVREEVTESRITNLKRKYEVNED